MTNKVYAAFFMGMGGSLLSLGIQALAARARSQRVTTDVREYIYYPDVVTQIATYRTKGYKIALIGYSAGCITIGFMQAALKVKNDLLVSIAQSELTANYVINKGVTKRSVLCHGDFPLDILSSAGTNLGYDLIHEMGWPHLLADWGPDVQSLVLKELAALQNAVE